MYVASNHKNDCNVKICVRQGFKIKSLIKAAIFNYKKLDITTSVQYLKHKKLQLFDNGKMWEHCLKLERWQGPPNVNKVKQYEIVVL